jgi:hypothetical protein
MAATATALPSLLGPPASEDKPVPTATIARGDLKAVFRDNSQSPKILSGAASLVNHRDAPGFDAFDPDSPGASTGLNFEHISCIDQELALSLHPAKGALGEGVRVDRGTRGRRDVARTATHDHPLAILDRTDILEIEVRPEVAQEADRRPG